MSEREKRGVYVYQPYPMSRKDGKLWHIGGLPSGLTREEAEAVVEAINGIGWLMERCVTCGHRLSFPSDRCPQCRATAPPSWDYPDVLPDICACERCQKARVGR